MINDKHCHFIILIIWYDVIHNDKTDVLQLFIDFEHKFEEKMLNKFLWMNQ